MKLYISSYKTNTNTILFFSTHFYLTQFLFNTTFQVFFSTTQCQFILFQSKIQVHFLFLLFLLEGLSSYSSSSAPSVSSSSSYSYVSSMNNVLNLVIPGLFWDFFGFRDSLSLVLFLGTWVFNFVDFVSVLVGWILAPGLGHDVSASIILVHMFELGITSPSTISSLLSFKNMESFWMSLSQMHLALYFILSGIISNTEFKMLDFLLLNSSHS